MRLNVNQQDQSSNQGRGSIKYTDEQEHAVEGCGPGASDGEGAGEPAGGAECVGQAEHPGADDGDDDVPDRLRGRRATPPPLQERHIRLRRHRRPPAAINAAVSVASCRAGINKKTAVDETFFSIPFSVFLGWTRARMRMNRLWMIRWWRLAWRVWGPTVRSTELCARVLPSPRGNRTHG
jgi:hypothetical protein